MKQYDPREVCSIFDEIGKLTDWNACAAVVADISADINTRIAYTQQLIDLALTEVLPQPPTRHEWAAQQIAEAIADSDTTRAAALLLVQDDMEAHRRMWQFHEGLTMLIGALQMLDVCLGHTECVLDRAAELQRIA